MCVCVCACVCVWGGGGGIAWVREGVCGWDSLDCCRKVHVCEERGRRGGVVCVCVCVCVCGWV